jgi:ATP-dependent helicase/nuclease subunit A
MSVEPGTDAEARQAEPPAVDAALALDRNLALMAGAGAGKTWSLVALCLHVLGGARARAEPLPPARLVLVTFTEKAAGELKDRLRHRLRALAAGKVEGEEVLVRAFARLGRPFPPPEAWQQILEALGSAFVGTFHGMCVQLLRRAPPGVGVDPGFILLDEEAADGLVRGLAGKVVLEALQQGNAEVETLCREWGYEAPGRGEGVVDALVSTLTRLREEGRAAAGVPVTRTDEARARFEAGLARARAAWAEARAALESRRQPSAWGEVLQALAGPLADLGEETFLSPGGFARVRDALKGARVPPSGAHKEAVAALKDAVLGTDERPGLEVLHAGLFAEPQERAFAGLLAQLERALAEHFAAEGALDFTELLTRTRNLLRDVPGFRAEVQGRVGALLVDEFQDTNRLQLELVHLLAEAREGAPRPVASSDEVLGLPLEPGMLCAVGDRKQSIYGFRGADVSVFELLARRVEASGGARAFLKDNRRSTPALLRRFNHAFARVLRGQPEAADEVAYVPAEDDLRPTRPDVEVGPPLERLLPPAEGADRALEADVLARRLAQLLAPGAPGRVAERDGTLRPVRGADVAVLFRAFTHLETWRQALIRHGVPHRVLGGRGFYAAQEILDVASFLAWVGNPQDRLALAAVVRAPFVGLTDAQLYELHERTGLSIRRVREWAAAPQGGAALAAGPRERLQRLLALHATLAREWDRLPLRAVVAATLDETGYRVAAAAMPGAEQGLANLAKLEELAGAWEGDGGLPAFARSLVARAGDQPREEQALALDAGDTRAVQLLTIHRSKGLEWPVVVLPELGSERRTRGGLVAWDRGVGLALAPVLPVGGTRETERLLRARQGRRRSEEAESRRLLYVALTRARDKVILAGAPRRARGETWWHWLDDALSDAGDAPVEDLRPETLAPVRAARSGGPGAQLPLLAPAPRPQPARALPDTLLFPVTQLQDFFRCPRRYRYLHALGLSEARVSLELEEAEEAPRRGPPDARASGVLAHAVLETLPLEVLGDPGALDAAASALLRERGLDPERADLLALRAELGGFARGPLARRMAALGPARVHRELPFLLRVGAGSGRPGLHLRGQVDLLLEDDDGGVTVVDYKYAERPAAPFHAYGFQLDCYALAARGLVPADVPVRTGLVFLRGGAGEALIRPAVDAERPEVFEQRLLEGAVRWREAARFGRWEGLPRSSCEQLRCGFVARCHPRESGV